MENTDNDHLPDETFWTVQLKQCSDTIADLERGLEVQTALLEFLKKKVKSFGK